MHDPIEFRTKTDELCFLEACHILEDTNEETVGVFLGGICESTFLLPVSISLP